MNQPSCPINLGNSQKRKRLVLGITLFSLAGALAVYFTYEETPVWIRCLLFFPYFIAMLGFLQAKQRTCVVFAYKNVKDLGQGMEPVGDKESGKFLKMKAQTIVVQSLFIAFLLTAVSLLIR